MASSRLNIKEGWQFLLPVFCSCHVKVYSDRERGHLEESPRTDDQMCEQESHLGKHPSPVEPSEDLNPSHYLTVAT